MDTTCLFFPALTSFLAVFPLGGQEQLGDGVGRMDFLQNYVRPQIRALLGGEGVDVLRLYDRVEGGQ